MLDEIDGASTPEILVFNQIDRLPPGVGAAIADRHGGVAVSALERRGFEELLARAGEKLWEAGGGANGTGGDRAAVAAQGG